MPLCNVCKTGQVSDDGKTWRCWDFNCSAYRAPFCSSKHPQHGQCSLQRGHAQATVRRHVAFVTQCGVDPATWTDEDSFAAEAEAIVSQVAALRHRSTEEVHLALRHISQLPDTFRQQDVFKDLLEERDALREQVAAIRKTIG